MEYSNSSTMMIAFSLAIFLTFLSQTSPMSDAKSGGFSIQLIHPASKRSPASLSTELVPDLVGGYLLNFSVGTPPKFQLALADSGSHVNWIQCEPCLQCFSQNLPIFNPLNSSTYKALPCNSPKCFQNDCQGSQCTYAASYFDQSYSFGDLATEMFTFYSPQGDQEISFPDIVFGCAHRSKLANIDPKLSGFIGLGVSAFSLVSQISPAFGLKFSYCFVPLAQLNVPSTLTFGENAWGSTGAVFTPMLQKPSSPFYFLTLLGISVGGKRFSFYNNSSTIFPEGNIAIDSGTTKTVLPTPLYNQVRTMVVQAIGAQPMVEKDSTTNPCYEDLNAIDIPPVTMHFIAAELPLSKDNIMFPDGQGGGCLAFQPTEGQTFYGNIAQTNFLVGYDLDKMIVSFKAFDCTKLA